MTSTDTKTQTTIHSEPLFFETDDLALSAYLMCNGCTFQGIKQSIIPGKLLFVFLSTPKIDQLTTLFHSFEATVTPQSYYSAIRDLKRIMTEYKNFGKKEVKI